MIRINNLEPQEEPPSYRDLSPRPPDTGPIRIRDSGESWPTHITSEESIHHPDDTESEPLGFITSPAEVLEAIRDATPDDIHYTPLLERRPLPSTPDQEEFPRLLKRKPGEENLRQYHEPERPPLRGRTDIRAPRLPRSKTPPRYLNPDKGKQRARTPESFSLGPIEHYYIRVLFNPDRNEGRSFPQIIARDYQFQERTIPDGLERTLILHGAEYDE